MTTLSVPSIIVNNVPYSIVPNSFSYTEGFGEQKLRTQSSGGNAVQQIYSNDAAMQYSDVKFSLVNTADNIAAARIWKSNTNQNVIEWVDTFTNAHRVFTNAALTNNYEVQLSADGVLELEWMADRST